HQTDSAPPSHIQKSGCFHAGTTIEFALDAEVQATRPAHHRASTDKRNRLISPAFENHVAVFETRGALLLSLVTAWSIRSFHTRARVGIKLNSQSRTERSCIARAEKARIIQTHNHHDA